MLFRLKIMLDNNMKTAEETWDAIAESFDVTRKKPWNQCIEFINNISKNDIVADIGCGNGRHLIPCARKCSKIIGIDISRNLLNIVKKKLLDENINNVSLFHANMVELPIKKNSIDSVICIASIHNVKGRFQRIQSIKEIFRILRKNGTALISVWSKWQDKYRIYFLKKLFTHKGEFGDINIYWRQNNLNIPRFYHLYSKREFLKDLTEANFVIDEIVNVKIHSTHSADNFFAKVRKE
jgi:alkylated DNA repair protein alkB family protein 8